MGRVRRTKLIAAGSLRKGAPVGSDSPGRYATSLRIPVTFQKTREKHAGEAGGKLSASAFVDIWLVGEIEEARRTYRPKPSALKSPLSLSRLYSVVPGIGYPPRTCSGLPGRRAGPRRSSLSHGGTKSTGEDDYHGADFRLAWEAWNKRMPGFQRPRRSHRRRWAINRASTPGVLAISKQATNAFWLHALQGLLTPSKGYCTSAAISLRCGRPRFRQADPPSTWWPGER